MVSLISTVLPVVLGAFPEAFDARDQWPDCVTPVRDSGDAQDGSGCASEWAMSATQTLQTNLCVMGRKTPTLSAEQVGSCYPTRGTILCTAWVIPTAWLYIEQLASCQNFGTTLVVFTILSH